MMSASSQQLPSTAGRVRAQMRGAVRPLGVSRVTQLAGQNEGTAADFDTSGSGETVAPKPYELAEVPGPLSREELRLTDAWWRAANYLAVGQIYLMGDPLLREPLLAEDVKPRLLGHFGTVPGLNLLHVHMNRLIKARDL